MAKAAEQEVKSTAVGANLIEEEKMEIGGVKWEVYSYYAKSIGVLFTSGTFLLYAVYQGFSLGSNIWLSKWSTDPRAAMDTSVQNMYLAVYGVLGIFQVRGSSKTTLRRFWLFWTTYPPVLTCSTL